MLSFIMDKEGNFYLGQTARMKGKLEASRVQWWYVYLNWNIILWPPTSQVRLVENEAEEYETDSGEEEEWWHPEVKQGEKVQVTKDFASTVYSLCNQVFFTRNGKIIGKKEVMLPKGGFYPTVGMMSSQEKVRVELKPLSG